MQKALDMWIVKHGKPKPHFMGGHVYERSWTFRGRVFNFSMRTSDGMGRFGGGWNAKIGIQWGVSTTIISLLYAELSIRRQNAGK